MRRFIHSRTLRIVAAAASVLLGAVALAPAAQAATATYYVATTGSDTTFNNASNDCTFSQAPCLTVQHAVNVASGLLTGSVTAATVSIAAGTYHEAVSIPAVPAGESLSLVGAGASSTTINATGTNTSVITVNRGTVDITGLTVTGGNSNSNGGGIYNAGTLTVSGSTISGNSANLGGGIANYGRVTVSGSTISGNTATYGGGVYSRGTVTVSGSTISDNSATYGGGIFNNPGDTLTVSGSTISGNSATDGGAIENHGTASASGSTISGNTATNYGGGIYNGGVGTVSVLGSTISGNTANYDGGGIYNYGTVTVSGSTISGNTAGFGGGGINNNGGTVSVSGSTISGNTAVNYGGGGIYNGGTVTVSGSILSGDGPTECAGLLTVTDGGYNVTSDSSCGFGATSKVSTVAAIGLGSLAANGSTGPFTEAISSTSSAHQVVPVAHCAATDERGLPRPGSPGATACDAGAFELQSPIQSQTITFSPTSPAVYGSSATLSAAASSKLAVTYTVEASSVSVCTISGSTVTYIGVGSCVIDANQGGSSGFSAAPQVPGTVTVIPAALTVTGPSPSPAYGQPIPALNPTYSGFVNGDTAASLSSAATCTTTATSTSVPGTYPVTCSGAVDANYTITYTPGKLTVTKAPTTTTLTVNPSPPAVNQATTLKATVHHNGNGAAPTGKVFFYDGTTLLGPATVQPDGTATLTTTFGGGGHSITAVYGGDTNYTGSTSTPPTPLTVGCSTVITGTHASFTAGPGTTCVLNATITGGISVPRGSTLDVENSTVQGSISAGSPAGIRICGSTLSSFAVTGATGYVRIGDPANNCAPNTITGGLTAANNTGGGTISGNTIAGSTTITNNTPPFTAVGNHH